MTTSTLSPVREQDKPDWQPTFSPWRHGGWYVDNLRYPSGAVGCVSRNYPDKKWRIACDPRPFEERPTFPNRKAAAFGERELIAVEENGGFAEYSMAGLQERDNVQFAQRLKAAFPWLGTEEDAGSGADVIETLSNLYNAARLKPDTQRRVAEGIKKHCPPPKKLTCPSCGSEEIRSIADGIISRPIISYTPKLLLISGLRDGKANDEESEKNDRLECKNCTEQFPIPNGVAVDYD